MCEGRSEQPGSSNRGKKRNRNWPRSDRGSSRPSARGWRPRPRSRATTLGSSFGCPTARRRSTRFPRTRRSARSGPTSRPRSRPRTRASAASSSSAPCTLARPLGQSPTARRWGRCSWLRPPSSSSYRWVVDIYGCYTRSPIIRQCP